MKLDPRRVLGSIIMFFLAPLIIIAAFNHFFAVNVPWTFESWVVVFLVGVLTVILFIGVTITVESYFLVALVMIGNVLLSGLVKGVK